MSINSYSSDSLRRAEQTIASSGVAGIMKAKKEQQKKTQLSKGSFQNKLKDKSSVLNPLQDKEELHQMIEAQFYKSGTIEVESHLKQLPEFTEFEQQFFQGP